MPNTETPIGLTETRAFDGRYAPEEIRVDGTGTLLRWSYATDAVGNISSITDLLTSANNRTYGYQDVQYFLTQGNGPWGLRSWTYDRIGNRLTETRGALTDTYAYPTNPAGGHNPRLQSINFGAGGTHTFSYDAVGNTTQVYKSYEVLQLIYDGASRLSTLRSIPEDARTHFAYDGRSFLRRAEGDVDECHPGVTVPTYDSEGLLRRREHRKLFIPAAPPQDSETVPYFAGQPLARCGGSLFAGGTRIVCNNSAEACGQTWPNGTITLYRGNSTCPRIFEGREKGPTGPRDFSQTLFHEIGHTCGVGPEEPNWWKDLQTVCTGWPL